MFPRLLNPKVSAKSILILSCLLLTSQISHSSDIYSDCRLTLTHSLNAPNEVFQDDQVYDVADKMPRPVGGQDGWEEYLAENLNYPTAALKSKIEGVVYVVFILEKDGRTSNVSAIRGIGAGCEEEAERLVEGSPKWTPGKNNGEPVRVRMRIPIRFHLPN